MAEARAALRQLVRAIDSNITSKAGNPLWRQAVFAEFRRHTGESDAGTVARLVQEARDVAFYLDSVKTHKELLVSYNIGVDRQKRQRQKLSDSARSVGLSLPDWTN